MKRVIAVLLMSILGILSLGLLALFGWWAGKLMVARGRDKEWGWIWGSVGGGFAVIVIACLPDKKKAALSQDAPHEVQRAVAGD